MARCFVTRRIPGPALDRLIDAHDVDVWPHRLPPTPDELREHVSNVEGLLSLLTDTVDEALLEAAPDLRAISNYAVGTDNVDLDAATRARHPGRQHPRRAHRRDRRPRLRAHARVRAAPARGRARRARRPVGDVRARPQPRRRGDGRDARDRRLRPHRPGGRAARGGLRDGGAPQRALRRRPARGAARALRLRQPPLPAHARHAPPDRLGRPRPDEADRAARSTPRAGRSSTPPRSSARCRSARSAAPRSTSPTPSRCPPTTRCCARRTCSSSRTSARRRCGPATR